ncbi:unnamed protein product [Paramecium pentaurelia]|uniref:RRM domain-containing protein n=1 Tax=Paramecium pentaurelia TaxID=43138 RepID=A0A8S1U164_9CILI|nr:unnamed protein product [Paramecium pentaurelia]
MGEIVSNQLFVAGYSRAKITDEKDIKNIFKKYGTIKNVAYKGSYAFVTFSSESEAENALKALNGQQINGQKLKDVEMDLKKMMNVLDVRKEDIGLESVQMNHRQKEGIMIIKDHDIEKQEDQTQDPIHNLHINLLTLGEKETLKKEIDTVEEVEVQKEIKRDRKVPVKRDPIQIQVPDHKLRIDRDNHIDHLYLNEKWSKQRKRNQKLNQQSFSVFYSLSYNFQTSFANSQKYIQYVQILKQQKQQINFVYKYIFLRHFYYYLFIEKMNERFEQNLQEILQKDCLTQNKNLLLKGQIELLKLQIRDQKLIKQQQDQELKEIEKKQVMQNLKEEQQKQIEEKEIQLIKQKRELHLRQDACEDLQFEIEQQYQHLKIQQENHKILDESIKRLMDCIQKSKKSPLKNQQFHNRVATSHSFDDRVNPFGIMGMLKSKNNVDDYIQKVEKINTSRLYDH